MSRWNAAESFRFRGCSFWGSGEDVRLPERIIPLSLRDIPLFKGDVFARDTRKPTNGRTMFAPTIGRMSYALP